MTDIPSLSNRLISIEFRGETGAGLERLVDLETGCNLLSPSPQPLYRIVLARGLGDEIELTSADAESVAPRVTDSAGERSIVLSYGRHKGLDVRVTCTARLPCDSALSYWRISVENRTDLGIRGIHFPVVVTPESLGVDSADAALRSRFTPRRLVYSRSRAFSLSINATIAPDCCAIAMD